MKNFSVILILTGIYSIVNLFSNKPEPLDFKAPVIMSNYIIEREEYRDSLVESVKKRTEQNTLAIEKIEIKIQQLKDKK